MTPAPYRLQRLLDWAVLVSLSGPILAVAAVAAVAIKLGSRGPVLYSQPRIGLGGAPFQVFKFRTMLDGDNPLVPNEDRITGAGRWLRRISIDELPQLINVAKGEMSIVGPRPMQPFQAERCVGIQTSRHAVRPGLTGLAQISGRNSLSWDQRIELDLVYVASRSLKLDMQILTKTARAVLSGDGVDGHPLSDRFVLDPDTFRLVMDMTERRNGTARERRRRERRVSNVWVQVDQRVAERRSADRRTVEREIRIRRQDRPSPIGDRDGWPSPIGDRDG